MAGKQTVKVHKKATSRKNSTNNVMVRKKRLVQSNKQKAEVAHLSISQRWTKNFEEWKEYCKKHKTPYVHYSLNRNLYEWARNQRRERTNLSAVQIELLDKAGFRWEHDRVAARIAIEQQKSSNSSSHDTNEGTSKECRKSKQKRAPLNDEVRKERPARVDSAQSNGAINDIDVSNTDKDETKSMDFAKFRGCLIDSKQDNSKRLGENRGRPPKSDTHHLARKRGIPSTSCALSIESSNGQAEDEVSA